MASGKTLEMRAIRVLAPVVVHRNIGAPRWVRRNPRLLRQWKGSFLTNESYIYPARDLRPGRKLRRATDA